MSKRSPRPKPMLCPLTTAERLFARRRLTSFLYVLMRDDVTVGKIEDIMGDHISSLANAYSNPFLADYAESLADRLILGIPKHKPARAR